VDDWKAKLAGLNQNLQAKDRAEQEQQAARKAAGLLAFRKRLPDLEPVLQTAAEFGDAFGVDCEWEISRFDQRYPSVEFRIRKPKLTYRVECREGRLYERLAEGPGTGAETEIGLEAVTARRVQERVTAWVQAAANANRKVPGKRS
jgi:hypothetical protein